MSWYFEGRTYHNYSELQNARAAADRRRAGTAVDEVHAENRRLAESIQRDRKQVEILRGDVKKQMEAAERIRANVRSVERNQQRLDQMMQDSERRMQSGFAEIERELEGQRAEVHGVKVDVAQLRTQHQQHVEEVRRQFGAARAETQRQIDDVRKQQQESEQRLKESIREVDGKVEHDRAERAKRTQDQLALAESEVKAAAEALARVGSKIEGLDLANDLQQVANRLAVARNLIAQRNASAALSTTMLANADAGSLERKAAEREIEMVSYKQEVDRRVHWIERTLGPEATEDMKDCFRLENEEILREAAAAKEHSWSPGKTYNSFAHLRDRTDEALTQLENRTLEIVSSAPLVAEAAMERAAKVEDQIATLEKVYGGVTQVQQSYAMPMDPKSDMLVELKFGSTTVELRAPIDGKMSVDGYNHGSAGACASAAQQVVAAQEGNFLVSQQRVDSHDRAQPVSGQSSRSSVKSGSREFDR